MSGSPGKIPTALARRIRQHLIGRPQVFFAVTLPGLARLCREELAALPDAPRDMAVDTGGVRFEGRLTTCYQANLMCRTPTRILMRVARFKAAHFGALQKGVCAVPWELLLNNEAPLAVQVSTRQSKLYHRGAVAERIVSAVQKRLSVGPVPAIAAPVKSGACLWARLHQDQLTLSLDSSGDPLYKRGIKIQGGPAPLRETLAAAILMLAGYDGQRPLCDPMCGSGTFAIEAAMMLKQIPPGWYRSFAFMDWPAFREPHWRYLRREAGGAIEALPQPAIWASDRSRSAVAQLAERLAGSDLNDAIDLQRRDFFDLKGAALSARGGLVVLNPPHGRRLGQPGTMSRLLGEILHKLQLDFRGWRTALLLPQKRLLGRLPFPSTVHRLIHGGKPAWLAIGTIAP
jgi:putative N6-adenine-specific DNA methylase